MAKRPYYSAMYALHEYLEANVDTYLTEMETDLADGTVLDDFEDYSFGYHELFNQPYRTYLMVVAGTLGEDPEAFGTVQAEVVFALQDADPELLARKQLLYTEAVWNCLVADRSLGGKVTDAEMRGGTLFPAALVSKDCCVVNLQVELTSLEAREC